MRLALSGRSGSVIGLDYRGERVLAAYEPVGELNLGIVAKIDLSEMRAPFVKAGFMVVFIAMLVIVSGAVIFIAVTNPLIKKLQDSVSLLEQALSEVRTLKGILPICSFCKKIRNDAGYWEQVDHYIHEHTDADFSHGVCPDCMAKHYPDVTSSKK
ncbi:hypothetical protein EG829_32330 [bacterium]|nr:hypothetical protein [bacterium]